MAADNDTLALSEPPHRVNMFFLTHARYLIPEGRTQDRDLHTMTQGVQR